MRQWLSRMIDSFRRRTADDVVPEPLSDWEYDELALWNPGYQSSYPETYYP